jgi:hypothetical protein
MVIFEATTSYHQPSNSAHLLSVSRNMKGDKETSHRETPMINKSWPKSKHTDPRGIRTFVFNVVILFLAFVALVACLQNSGITVDDRSRGALGSTGHVMGKFEAIDALLMRRDGNDNEDAISRIDDRVGVDSYNPLMKSPSLASPSAQATKPRKISSHLRGGRRLDDTDLSSFIASLLDTPIDEWNGEQWLVFFALFVVGFIVFCCLFCSCLLPMCCCGSRRNGGYGGSSGSCFRDMLLCFCCYELFCRGGDDICGGGGGYDGGFLI